MLHLARRDQDTAGGDKAADNRVGQQVGEEAQPQEAKHCEHDAGQRRECALGLAIKRSALCCDGPRRALPHKPHHIPWSLPLPPSFALPPLFPPSYSLCLSSHLFLSSSFF